MAVEAAVGQAGVLHQFGHADAVEAPFAKQTGGLVDDLLTVGGGLFLADSHAGPLAPGGRFWMMDIIYIMMMAIM